MVEVVKMVFGFSISGRHRVVNSRYVPHQHNIKKYFQIPSHSMLY